MICHSYESFFETFSNKTRLKIIESLSQSPKSVNQIAKSIDEEQSKVSHNLKKLMECNFLDVQQKGKQRIYSLNKDTIIPLLQLVEKHVHKYCNQACKKRTQQK